MLIDEWIKICMNKMQIFNKIHFIGFSRVISSRSKGQVKNTELSEFSIRMESGIQYIWIVQNLILDNDQQKKSIGFE